MRFYPDDERSRAKLPEAITTKMDAIKQAQRRQRELGRDWADQDRLRHKADEADKAVVAEYLHAQKAKGREADEISLDELESLLTHGKACEERLRASRLAAEAAGSLVSQRIEDYVASVREAAGLPAGLETEAAQLVSDMDTALSTIDATMNEWIFLVSLAEHVRAVQVGQNPGGVNTKGDEPRLSHAVSQARQAIRLRTRGASLDDKIAAGVIFGLPVIDPAQGQPQPPAVDTSVPGVYSFEVPSR